MGARVEIPLPSEPPTGLFRQLATLETDRLRMRPLALADALEVFAYARDPEVARTLTWEPHASLADSERFVQSVLEAYERDEAAPWALVLKETGRVVGTLGFGSWSKRHKNAEIGYALAREHWNRGLMTEAVEAALRFGFTQMGLHRIEARCLPENRASARVLEKNGMRREGTLRDAMFVKGAFRTLHVYAILRNEWLARGA